MDGPLRWKGELVPRRRPAILGKRKSPFFGGSSHCATKWSQVVKVALWALESSGSAPKRVPGPSRTGRAPSQSRRSNSPTDFLPPCRETLAFAGLLRRQAAVLRRARGMVGRDGNIPQLPGIDVDSVLESCI